MLATTIDPVCQPEITHSRTAAFAAAARIGAFDGLRSTLAIFGRRDAAGREAACLIAP